MASGKRNANESFQRYRSRLNAEQMHAETRSKGRLIWDSHNRGTYIRAKHGSL